MLNIFSSFGTTLKEQASMFLCKSHTLFFRYSSFTLLKSNTNWPSSKSKKKKNNKIIFRNKLKFCYNSKIITSKPVWEAYSIWFSVFSCVKEMTARTFTIEFTLSTLFPTSILMHSWLLEYSSTSFAHISTRFVNVSRRVTS